MLPPLWHTMAQRNLITDAVMQSKTVLETVGGEPARPPHRTLGGMRAS